MEPKTAYMVLELKEILIILGLIHSNSKVSTRININQFYKKIQIDNHLLKRVMRRLGGIEKREFKNYLSKIKNS